MAKRRVTIRGGIEDHLLRGLMTAYDFGLYVLMHLQCDYQTGLWWGSASRLLVSIPGDNSLRKVQRALQRLQEGRYIRTFRGAANKGNYPTLIDKYEPQYGPHKGKRLDAWASDSWQALVWVDAAEGDAVGVTQGVTRGVTARPCGVTYSVSKKQKAIGSRESTLSVTQKVGFESFWEAYPRPVAKPRALKAWARIREVEYPDVLAGLAIWRLCEQWADLNFVPYPATFLNGKQWQDTPVRGSNGEPTGASGGVSRQIAAVQQRQAVTAESLRTATAFARSGPAKTQRALPPADDDRAGGDVHGGPERPKADRT